MQFGVERAVPRAVGRGQPVVEGGEGAVEVARQGFPLRYRDLEEPVEYQGILLAEAFGAEAQV